MFGVVVTAGGRIGDLEPEVDAWLRALEKALTPADHLFGAEPQPEPVLRRAAGGGWHVGEFAGEIRMSGRTLRVVAPDGCDVAIATAVGRLWSESVEHATRHGPPAIRRDVPHEGASLRGRLDVRRSVRLRASASTDIASIYRARDLRNDISRALVAADNALTRQVGHDRWRSRRVREVMPQVHAAVGRRAGVPTLAQLARIPYSPITRPFREAAELSVRIVLQDPVLTTALPGRPQGVLVPLRLARG